MATLDSVAISRTAARWAVQELLRKVFSFPVFLGALLGAGVFATARLSPSDPDTWWHIAVGEQILRAHSWPTADPYSFTASGTRWIAYEWLGEVLMAAAALLGGLAGRMALLIVLCAVVLLLLYYYAWLRSKNVKAAFVACTLLLPLSGLFFTLRPQLLGYVFLLLTLICLERFRQGRQQSLWVLPGIFLLWVNTHGSFAFGLAVVALFWLSGLFQFRWGGLTAERWTPEQRRHLAVVFLLSLGALTLTPYGAHVAAYPLEMALFQPVNVANIIEWMPLSPDLVFGKMFLGLLLLFFLGQVILGLTYRLEEMALLLFAVFSAAVHRRFLFLFVLVFAPLLAAMLARWLPGYHPAKDRFVLNAVLMLLIVSGMAVFFPSHKALEELVSRSYPDKAVAYLQQHPVNGPVFNEYGWGGYLIWSRQKVFIDGRADVYEYAGVLPDYLSIVNLESNTLPLLRKYGIEACLIRPDVPLATFLAALPDWEQVYSDQVSALFVRKYSGP